MSPPVIGVIGAAGAVGSVAAAQLHRWGCGRMLLAGRRLAPVRAMADQLRSAGPASDVQAVAADIDDESALRAFCAQTTLVLNCAGPAHRIGARVAAAALAAGAHYVDAAGDDELFDRVSAVLPPGRGLIAGLSAGMMPGLTALLPRYLAGQLAAPVQQLLGYVGGRDRFTDTAADDYLRSAGGFGQPGAALVGGVRVPGRLVTLRDTTLPFFDEPVTALPYLSTELERVAHDLKLADVTWYSAYSGTQVVTAMRRAGSGTDGAAELKRAADLDSFGRATYQLIVTELSTGTAAGAAAAGTAVLRGRGASELTGAFAAATTAMVLRGQLNPGVHHAGEALAAQAAMQLVQQTGTVDELTVLAGSAADAGGYLEETL